MTDKDTKHLEGEILSPEQQPVATTRSGWIGLKNIVGYLFQGHAIAKAGEIETRVETAHADAAEARERRINAEVGARSAEQLLTEDNLRNMEKSVAATVRTKLDTSQQAKEKAVRDRERQTEKSNNDDSEEKLRGIKINEDILAAELRSKKLKKKLEGDEIPLAGQILKAEQKRDLIIDELADAKQTANGDLDLETSRALSKKLQSANDQLERLYERRNREEDDLED